MTRTAKRESRRRAIKNCVFCDIVAGAAAAHVVAETDHTFAFLDIKPVFPGHVLIVPKVHVDTLEDLTDHLLVPLFAEARLVARAVVDALGAQGSFVAMNNRVSQSVPHLHVHVVPRTKGDGLRGFFWPRTSYPSADAAAATAATLAGAVARLRA